MENSSPLIYKQSADEVTGLILTDLESTTDWRKSADRSRPSGGEAMARLFGRLADLIIARLNQVPENHFRAFLDSAGVDLLPPRPAKAEITFFPAKDAPDLVRVAAGTQIAAKKSESRPEVVFETEQDLNVVKTELSACIVVDPVRISDRTSEAAGEESGSFAAFIGEAERKRVLYIGDDSLFVFADDASRNHATVILSFDFNRPGDPANDGWAIKWSYFDGTDWLELVENGGATVQDSTGNFSKNGEVRFSNLPALTKSDLDKTHGAWLSCELTGGTGRGNLPVVEKISGKRVIDIPKTEAKAVDAAFSALHAGAALVPLKAEGEFFPLGQRPGRFDAFYIKADEPFAKEGANVEISLDLLGLTDRDQGDELTNLRVEWGYASDEGWTPLGVSSRSGVSASILRFSDETMGFTKSGDGLTVSFSIPKTGNAEKRPLFSKTKVGDLEGYWLRARVTAGGYGIGPDSAKLWDAPVVLAPSVKKLKVSYGGFKLSDSASSSLTELHTLVDKALTFNADSAADGQFAPFASNCDVPALFLGFTSPFPSGEWVKLLLDTDEERSADAALPALVWEYWSGDIGGWESLPVSDESMGLSRRGYLGFYGPKVWGKRVEFGNELYWLRIRTHIDLPTAKAPENITVEPGQGGEATIRLDGSGSTGTDGKPIVKYIWTLAPPKAEAGSDIKIKVSGDEAVVKLDGTVSGDLSGREIARYSWRLVSSGSLIARAGDDMVIQTEEESVKVQLDASGSIDAKGGEIRKYIWRKVLPEKSETSETPYLKKVLFNTVLAINGTDVYEETLGSSNGKGSQSFSLLRTPLLPNAGIYVRETDQMSAVEKESLQREHDFNDETDSSEALPLTIEADKGIWALWRRVEHFYSSTPADRHYILDPIKGTITFGDGKRGRIPPAGRDNIKAAFYHSHQGSVGNVDSGEVTILRNPSGALAAIKRVKNPEAAAGGSEEESVEEVRVRGPKTLKHRGKAITIEDYAWLARDAAGEVASAWCLPTRDKKGMIKEGWVTVVVIPKSSDAKPYPRPTLIRLVREYLESRALANLVGPKHIFVKGPEYIEVNLNASVVPLNAEKGDEVKLQIMERLGLFLHPLNGGPERKGWELGRDVYLSEVYTEIEAVSGVDYTTELTITGSLQQQALRLIPRVPVMHSVSMGSRIGTFDERLRLILAEPLATGEKGELIASVYGFKIGDKVRLVDSFNKKQLDGITITGISAKMDTLKLDMPYSTTENLPPVESLALLSSDEKIRIPLTGWEAEGEEETTAKLMKIEPGMNDICIVAGGQRYPEFEFMKVESVEFRTDRIFVPEGHLIYSGSHNIDMVLPDSF